MTSHITLNAKGYHLEIPTYQKGLANPMAAKLGQGAGDYGDLSDWSAWLMEGWAAGVGQRDPEAGGSLFATADTRFERQLTLPPEMRLTSFATDYFTNVENVEIQPSYVAAADFNVYIARKWTAPTAINTVSGVWVYLLEPRAVAGSITCGIWSDVAGKPGAPVGTPGRTKTITATGKQLGARWMYFDLLTINLAAGDFWIVVSGTEVWVPTVNVGWTGKAFYGDVTPAWEETNHGLFFAVDILDFGATNQQAAITRFNNELYLAKDLTLYRMTAGVWAAVHAFAVPITALQVYDGALHIGLGDSTNYQSMSTAGAFTAASVPARLLTVWGGYLYRAVGADVDYTNATGGTWLTTPIHVGAGAAIRGMAGMGDVNLYCATDEGLYYIGAGDFVFGVFPFPGVDAANGRGMINWQGDLYVPLAAAGLLRVTENGQILRMGLDQGEGLPVEYAGRSVGLAATANSLIAYIGQGTVGSGIVSRPTLWMWNGQGWHFLAAGLDGPAPGPLYYDRSTDRLYFGQHRAYVAYVTLAGQAENPLKDANARYAPWGWIEFPAYTGGLLEVQKDMESLYLDGEQLSSTASVDVYWRDDDSTHWENLGVITATGTEKRWTSNRPNTKKIRLGLLLRTTNATTTPIVRAIRLKYMAMVRDRFRWSFTVRVGTNLETVAGTVETRSAATQRADLWTAAASVPPVAYVDLDGTSYTVKVLDATETAGKYQRSLAGAVTYDGHFSVSLLQV